MEPFNIIPLHNVGEVVISPVEQLTTKTGLFRVQKIVIDGQFEIHLYYSDKSSALITLEGE